MAPISIDFLSNVSPFLRGTDDVEAALDDVGKSLDDVAKDGKSSTDKLAASGESAAEKIERSFSELAAATKRDLDNTASQTRRTFDRTSNDARRNLDEVKNEAKQNISETFSSFNGSATSFADALQGTLGGLIASLPPQLAVLGAAGALGIGLIVSQLELGGQKTEQMRAQTAELAQQMITTGEVGGEWLGHLVEKLQELATASDPNTTNLAELSRIAKDSTSSYKDLAQAYSGNGSALEILIRREERLKKALEDQSDAIDTTTSSGVREYEQTIKQIDGKERYLQKLRESKGVVDAAAQSEALYAAAGGPELERKAALVSAINDAYDQTAGSVDDYKNAETGLFDVTAYITAMQAREQALRDYQDTLAASELSPEAKDFLNSQGADAAAAFLAGYQAATPEQRAELNRIWTEAGQSDSAAYSDTLAKGFAGRTIAGPTVDLQEPNVDDLVNGLQSKLVGRHVRVTVIPVDRNGVEVP